MFNRKYLTVAAVLALLLVGFAAFGTTYPQWVANDATAGKYGVWGVGNSPFDQRLTTLHVDTDASAITLNVRHLYVASPWEAAILLPTTGFAAGDTTITVDAFDKATFVFPMKYDMVVVVSGTGDLWGE